MYDTDDKRKEYVISGSVSNNDIFNFSFFCRRLQ